ncbi:MAG TPA: hypothetical protein VNL36_05075 [Bacteroidota bacterium]|nr:hypothetical protein [Bacteroidota bacterium]
MTNHELECAHTCRNTCAMLNEALRRETALLQFYEQIILQCDYPDVHAFIRSLAEQRSQSLLRIVGKLNELQARSQAMDGVMSSFEP